MLKQKALELGLTIMGSLFEYDEALRPESATASRRPQVHLCGAVLFCSE
jgi:hypothetical protein